MFEEKIFKNEIIKIKSDKDIIDKKIIEKFFPTNKISYDVIPDGFTVYKKNIDKKENNIKYTLKQINLKKAVFRILYCSKNRIYGKITNSKVSYSMNSINAKYDKIVLIKDNSELYKNWFIKKEKEDPDFKKVYVDESNLRFNNNTSCKISKKYLISDSEFLFYSKYDEKYGNFIVSPNIDVKFFPGKQLCDILKTKTIKKYLEDIEIEKPSLLHYIAYHKPANNTSPIINSIKELTKDNIEWFENQYKNILKILMMKFNVKRYQISSYLQFPNALNLNQLHIHFVIPLQEKEKFGFKMSNTETHHRNYKITEIISNFKNGSNERYKLMENVYIVYESKIVPDSTDKYYYVDMY